MKPALLLNHAFLEGLAHRAEGGDENTRKVAQQPLVEVADTVRRARRVRREHAILHIHPALGGTEVAAGQPFTSWANQHRRDPSLGEALRLLLQLLSGPFVTSLAVDDSPGPADTVPSCWGGPAWIAEMILHAAHHGLSCGRSIWVLSYGPEPHLHAPIYKAERNGSSIDLDNLRTDAQAREAEARLSAQETTTTLSILEDAALHAERVQVLEPARSSAKRWELDCGPARLFDAIRHLDAFAKALDEGLPRETAAERYTLASGIEMSQEKANTLKKPTLREQRKFLIPGDREKQLFDMHAKPGPRTRVHVFARKERKNDTGAAQREHTVIYIGHCGEHLDLR